MPITRAKRCAEFGHVVAGAVAKSDADERGHRAPIRCARSWPRQSPCSSARCRLRSACLKSSGVPAFGSLPSARMCSTTAGSATSCVDLPVEPRGDLRRQLRRSDHAHPRRDREAREAGLGDGADIRQRRKARVAGDADGVQRACLIWPISAIGGSIRKSMRLPSSSVSAWLPPRNGTTWILMPASREKYSIRRCCGVPAPGTPQSTGSLRSFAVLIRSGNGADRMLGMRHDHERKFDRLADDREIVDRPGRAAPCRSRR